MAWNSYGQKNLKKEAFAYDIFSCLVSPFESDHMTAVRERV
jgi:hypothetical protein